MSLSLAISSCALPGKNARTLDRLARRNGWCVEFSSGFHYEADLPEKFLKARCRKLIHNYFPTPRQPFVLNLASLDETCWTRSVDHGRQGLRLAHEARLPFYSIHAGFCFDPRPSELGQPLDHYRLRRPRQVYWKRFLSAISILLDDAREFGVDLLIENNVVNVRNKKVPLLCADTQETLRLFRSLKSPRLGLLLDTGHLHVSARTLGFREGDFVRALRKHIRALHHSDNDGCFDVNWPLSESYWFLPFMPHFRKMTHVVEVCDLTPRAINAQFLLLRRAAERK